MIKSVDNSTVTAFCVHECEGSSRMGSRPRRYLFTGHSNGGIQVRVGGLLSSFVPAHRLAITQYSLLWNLHIKMCCLVKCYYNIPVIAKQSMQDTDNGSLVLLVQYPRNESTVSWQSFN